MKMAGIIFSNIHDNAMGELTRERTVASLPFGGRYRQVDFTLSNMVNSNIFTIGIITKYNYQSLMDHLSSVSEWDLNRKNGGLFFLPPFVTGNNGIYRGKLEALHSAISFLEKVKAEYVMLSGTTVICNINYEKVLQSHIDSGADVTVVANKESGGKNCEVVIKADGNTASLIALDAPVCNDFVGMEMYVIERELLLNVVKSSVSHGLYHFEREFLQKRLLDHSLSINVYPFDGVVLRNDSVPQFYKNNLALIDEDIRSGIFKQDAPIYTKTLDEEPTFYRDKSLVDNCLIANGCTIGGNVYNSVIFRDVKIEQGAVVKNSVIMQGTTIGRNSHIEQAIIDKDVCVAPFRVLVGAASSPVIIKKGERV